MTYDMASLTKKIIRGRPYYYLRESQRVNGKPKIVSTIYLGPPQRLLDRLLRPEPAQVALAEFGASAAVFTLAQALEVVATIDRHVPKRGRQGPSVGEYLLVAALNRCIAPCSKGQLDWRPDRLRVSCPWPLGAHQPAVLGQHNRSPRRTSPPSRAGARPSPGLAWISGRCCLMPTSLPSSIASMPAPPCPSAATARKAA
jgi:hypothetical protein